ALGARDAEPGRVPGGGHSKLLAVSSPLGSTPRDRERRSLDRTARPSMLVERGRFMAAIAGDTLLGASSSQGGAKPGRPNVHVMDLDRFDYHAPGTHQISRGACTISLPSGSGAFSKGAERRASIRLRWIDAP